MAINLQTFIDRANSVASDRTLTLDAQDAVQDKGRVRSALTSADTFSHTAREFIQAMTAEYGTHVGSMVRDMLRNHVEAGKPLTAGVVKEFVSLGNQHKVQDTLKAIMDDCGTMGKFVSELTGQPASLQLTDGQFQQLKALLRQNQATLVAQAARSDGTFGAVMASLQQSGALSSFQHQADVLTGNPRSPLGRMGYPWSTSPQMVHDKLHVLSLVEQAGGSSLGTDLLSLALSTIPEIRSHKPAPQEIGCSDLFNAMFPSGTTPGLERPSSQVLSLFTPAQMRELLTVASDVFQRRFDVSQLPSGSPFSGGGEAGLSAAKAAGVSPRVVALRSQAHLSLSDLPFLQGSVTADVLFDSVDEGEEALARSLCQREPTQVRGGASRPSITIVDGLGGRGEFTVGTLGLDGLSTLEKTDDQRAYLAGHPSQLSADICGQVKTLCSSEAQHKALLGCLAPEAAQPLFQGLSAVGTLGASAELTPISHQVVKNADGSLDVSLTTSPELSCFFGTGLLTYHVDGTGSVGISDFSWEHGRFEDRKASMLSWIRGSSSEPSLSSLLSSRLSLSQQGLRFLMSRALPVVEARVSAAGNPSELPGLQEVLDLFLTESSGEHPLRDVAKVSTDARAMLFASSCSPADREVFMEVVSQFDSMRDSMGMSHILDHLPELSALKQAGPLTVDSVWECLFKEPFQGASLTASPVSGVSAIGNRVFEEFSGEAQRLMKLEDAGASALSASEVTMRMQSGTLCFEGGMDLQQCKDIIGGKEYKRLTLADIRRPVACSVLAGKAEDYEAMKSGLVGDLMRLGIEHIVPLNQMGGTNYGPSQVTIRVPSEDPEAPGILTLTPFPSTDLREEDYDDYLNKTVKPMVDDLVDRLVYFCGSDQASQIVNVMMAIGQAGQGISKGFPGLFDMRGTEHGDAVIDVFGDRNRQVHIRYSSVEDCALDFSWEYVMGQDGSQKLVSLDMGKRGEGLVTPPVDLEADLDSTTTTTTTIPE